MGFFNNSGYCGDIERSIAEKINTDENYRYVRKQFKRTVFVQALNGRSEKAIQATTRHELFHEFYENFILRGYETIYKDYTRDHYFRSFKDELVAYLLQGCWTADLRQYVKYWTDRGNDENSLYNAIKEEVQERLLKDDGYDISDYTRVRPDCGTMRDFKAFLKEASR